MCIVILNGVDYVWNYFFFGKFIVEDCLDCGGCLWIWIEFLIVFFFVVVMILLFNGVKDVMRKLKSLWVFFMYIGWNLMIWIKMKKLGRFCVNLFGKLRLVVVVFLMEIYGRNYLVISIDDRCWLFFRIVIDFVELILVWVFFGFKML